MEETGLRRIRRETDRIDLLEKLCAGTTSGDTRHHLESLKRKHIQEREDAVHQFLAIRQVEIERGVEAAMSDDTLLAIFRACEQAGQRTASEIFSALRAAGADQRDEQFLCAVMPRFMWAIAMNCPIVQARTERNYR